MSVAVQSATCDLVVVGASLGGVSAVSSVLASLPGDFSAPVVVVQHRSSSADGLAALLDRHTALSVRDAEDGEVPAAGSVLVASAVRQLSLEGDGRLCSQPGRGSQLDPLLAQAAAVHGERLIAVVLTGRLDDGAAGVTCVKARGGRVIAQDRSTAVAFQMPAAAIATGCVDFVLPLGAIPAALVTLTMAPAAAELFRVGRPSWATPAV